MPRLQTASSTVDASSTAGSSSSSCRLVYHELEERAQMLVANNQLAPMVVMSYVELMTLGHFPRSSEGVTRPHADDGIIVFISHRWWRPTEPHPDDAAGSKYNRLCRGLRMLIAKHQFDVQRLALWVDCGPASLRTTPRCRQRASPHSS
eukprot:89884-Prymnesium_polylepis.1